MNQLIKTINQLIFNHKSIVYKKKLRESNTQYKLTDFIQYKTIN